MATFEQLRTVLNQIAEGPDKAVLEKAADHLSSDGSRYEIDLVISATNGTMVFIDHCPEVSED